MFPLERDEGEIRSIAECTYDGFGQNSDSNARSDKDHERFRVGGTAVDLGYEP